MILVKWPSDEWGKLARSLELEQLAVSGQRGVHLWQILSQELMVQWGY